ncbi:actin cytoskeleton-regulatory complex protein PAN1-like [Cryptomeria japonica]|uniref:actin cytoskeleton-regulatory complex protein PAN1-like n=1 Tax=Cryptomeria japonica TaxID=3369 RepID=UPI0027DA4842|nr:actin cytoskeleton-regulatory complex protein PAN1-like [Cryptomeria japonica]
MDYEVDVATLDGYAQHLLTTPVDEKEEKFGTAQEKGLKKKKRKEEREAKKEAQATPNVVPVTTEPPKQPKAPSSKPASPKLEETKKTKQKLAREYVVVSSKETELDEEIRQAPKKKGVFARVVRGQPFEDKKVDQKKEPKREKPKKSPKITIVHKRKPKGDGQSKLEAKKRTSEQKRLDAQEIIDQIINDGNLKSISILYDEFDEKDKK